MKHLLLNKPYQPFFVLGVVTAGIAIFLRMVYPASMFDVCIYNVDYLYPNYKIWSFFSIYVFTLTAVYYVIANTTLKARRWLVISHYIFILLLPVFFALFSSHSNKDVQRLIAGMPLNLVLGIYSFVLLVDGFLFVGGLVLLLVNLVTLKKKNLK
jgi:hypothetical protein